MAESKAMAPRLEGSMAEVEAGSSSRSQAKAKAMAKRPTWAEAKEMEKRLKSIDDKINDLSWRLNLEKFQACFGKKTLDLIFPSEASRCNFSQRSQEEKDLMDRCVDFTFEFMNFEMGFYPSSSSCTSDPAVVSKRLRKEDMDEMLSLLEEEESQKPRPHHIAVMEEELSRLTSEYVQLDSEMRHPDFSGMTEDDRAAEAERFREEAFQEATRLLVEEDMVGALRKQMEACFLDFDPKQGGIYHSSVIILAYSRLNLDLFEESPIGPMRFTNKVFQEKEIELYEGVNILSVKVAYLDVAFPIQVYGTVIARDCTDYKRVYLFRRDREHCQLIKSKDESLILTGPKRGLLLLDANYVETDLMIKDHEGQDRELSKGLLTISGTAGRSLEKCVLERLSLATRLSTVKVAYAVVISAVEATISIEVKGEFCGIVTAHTTSIKNRLVLYDSQLAGNGRGAIKMMRPVVSVYMKDTLIIVARVGSKAVGFKITPRIKDGDEVDFTLGTAKMRLRVAWSMLDLAVPAER